MWTKASLIAIILLVGCLSACGGASTTVTTGTVATATSHPIPCATHPTVPAEYAINGDRQVVHITGTTISAPVAPFSYPLGLPDEGGDPTNAYPSYLAVSPNGQMIAVLMNVSTGPGFITSYVYLINTATSSVTRLTALPAFPTDREINRHFRLFAWENDTKLLIFEGFRADGHTYVYDIGTGMISIVVGMAGKAAEGVVRCTMLFYLEITPLDLSTSFKGQARLHRFDLSTDTEVGSPVVIGDAAYPPHADAVIQAPGWDVTHDGTQIAFQQLQISITPAFAMMSQFVSARADGTHVQPILPDVVADVPIWVAIAPDDTLVATAGIKNLHDSAGNYASKLCVGALGGGDTPHCLAPITSFSYQLLDRAAWRDGSSFDYTAHDPATFSPTIDNFRTSTTSAAAILVNGNAPATNS